MTLKTLFRLSCPKCKALFATAEKDPNTVLVKNQRMYCPYCPTPVQMVPDKSKRKDCRVLTADQLYAAGKGLGLPEERNKTEKQLQKLLVGAKIVHVGTISTDPRLKVMINFLELDNNKRVWLGNGPYGPAIYKVTDVKRGAS